MVWEVTYVTFVFKDKNGNKIEKTKKIQVQGDDEAEAERNFLNKNLKFKRIQSIIEDNSNTLANLCPELLKLRNKLKKS
jgi:hypothetical protein